jgi:hypothetical protein
LRAKWIGVVGGSGPRSESGIGSKSFGAVVCGGRRADIGSASGGRIGWVIVGGGKEKTD